ncbi:acyl carrier protein [Anaerobacterium chartisolvens]|uniref:Acyl carrier protein n=1 Tax=Anaerobacterium chartisolvens TaxID=1297424 RepID=A0A369B8P9_9FIRM|nr:acyl carrier protein [Anaerobacterium chartisolvens]RCX16044.1 acyl carrier protein [Anaerobacterium chartisolvens]
MNLNEEVLELIIKKASELFKKDAGSLNGGTMFVEELDAKSVDYVKIIAVLEDEYGAEINFMEFRRKKTLGEAADYVAGLCG